MDLLTWEDYSRIMEEKSDLSAKELLYHLKEISEQQGKHFTDITDSNHVVNKLNKLVSYGILGVEEWSMELDDSEKASYQMVLDTIKQLIQKNYSTSENVCEANVTDDDSSCIESQIASIIEDSNRTEEIKSKALKFAQHGISVFDTLSNDIGHPYYFDSFDGAIDLFEILIGHTEGDMKYDKSLVCGFAMRPFFNDDGTGHDLQELKMHLKSLTNGAFDAEMSAVYNEKVVGSYETLDNVELELSDGDYHDSLTIYTYGGDKKLCQFFNKYLKTKTTEDYKIVVGYYCTTVEPASCYVYINKTQFEYLTKTHFIGFLDSCGGFNSWEDL